MITVKIDESDLLDMLVERVKHWTDDRDTINLYEQYYENMVYGGCFNGAELDIMEIVDNDYVNNLSILTKEEYETQRNNYLKSEIQDFIEENKDSYDRTDEDENKDYIEELKDFISDLVDEAKEWDDLETGDDMPDFSEYSGIVEVKTDESVLIS